MRKTKIERKTKETEILLELNLDGTGLYNIQTGIPFLNHMLELFSRHSGVDLNINAKGDIDIDYHHTVEDIGIVLGLAFNKALGDKKGIERYGFSILPMDEVLVTTGLDISGRNFFVYNVTFKTVNIKDFNVEVIEDFFKSFTDNAKVNLHINLNYGRNAHHIVESVFKSFAKSIKQAIKITGDNIPSTKGIL